jgi:class 3 adenylate cyclase/tetratricopeptide (TPR) repeat protein
MASPEVPASLIFGKYAVLRRLAQGGMGEIYLARQMGVSGFERPAILKSLLPDLLEQEGSVDMFLDEARVAGRLNHPNVVAIYEVGEWEGTFYIAMEYIEGEDLGKLARLARRTGAPLSPRVCAEIIRDAALGLDHAHHARDSQGQSLELVHRDISPQNIMVRLDGVTKVVDFGVAKAANRSTRTATGILKGKLRYMSPEQIRTEPLDGRSDQFALGAVLWELVTHQPLFSGENPVDVMRRIVQAPTPRPSVIVPELPPSLDAIILRMLAKPREQRFSRCAEVARALQAFLDETPPAPGDDVPAVVTRLVGEAVRTRLREAAENPEADARPQAGASVRCPRCGLATSGTSRFCSQCGSALAPEAPKQEAPATTPPVLQAARAQAATRVERVPSEVTPGARTSESGTFKRKLALLTALVEGAEALRRRLGDEEGLEAVGRLLDTAASIAERHGAEVVLLTEERFTFAFGLPAAREDDPLRAVRCALELMRAVAGLGLEPAPVLRVGLEFGLTLVSGGQGRSPWRVTGSGLERAGAIAALGGRGELLAGAAVHALLESEVQFGPARSGEGQPEPVYRVDGLGGVRRAVGPWVGRADALAAAEAVLESARSLRGGSRLFTGTAGMGKSRLLTLVAERAARAAPLRVVRASAADPEAAGAMGLVRGLLTGLARLLGPVSAEAPLASLEGLGFSRSEVLALWRRLSQGGPAGQLQAGDAALAEVLHRAASTGLLLLMDDVHRADAASLELLAGVLSAPDSRVALVGTSSREGVPAALGALPLTSLEGLSRGELRALLSGAFGAPLAPEVERLVAERSRGNPSFALELMRALVERGAVQRLGGAWQATAPLTESSLPDSLGLALGARVDRLTPAAQRFLTRAAVLGTTFSAALVRASLGEEADGAELLEALVAEGWVAPVPEVREGFRFTLELGREVLLGRLPQSALRKAHQELAEALARDDFAAEPARDVRLADHLSAAGSPGAAAACERAGDALATRGEWRAAAEYLRRSLGEGPGATGPARLRQLTVLARAAGCLHQVDPAGVEALVKPWLERIPASEAPAAWAEVARRQAAAELKLGRVSDAEARLAVTQGLAAGDPEVEAWVLGERARVREARGDSAGAVELLIQAFQRMGGRPARVPDFYWEHLNLLGRLQHRLGHADKARTSFTRAREQAQAVGSAAGQAKALANLAGLRAMAGESALALTDLERALVLAEQSGDIQEVARVHYNTGRLLLAGGRAAEARPRLESARERARLAGWREGEALATQALDALDARTARGP